MREQWPWQAGYLRLFLWVPTVFGVIATAIAWQHAGPQSLWYTSMILVGVLMRAVYAHVGRRVIELEAEFAHSGADYAQALTVINKMQAPGVVVLQEDSFLLVPILGERLELPFDQIALYKVGQWLPGKWVWGKRAFNFASELAKPLGFAVPESIGKRWAAKLALHADQQD
jgi:hypothetical protein